MNINQFRDLSRKKKCPHCRSSNTEIHSHPDNAACPLVYCLDCYGYPAICINSGQTYIEDSLYSSTAYCKVCGDKALDINTHNYAYPDL